MWPTELNGTLLGTPFPTSAFPHSTFPLSGRPLGQAGEVSAGILDGPLNRAGVVGDGVGDDARRPACLRAQRNLAGQHQQGTPRRIAARERLPTTLPRNEGSSSRPSPSR